MNYVAYHFSVNPPQPGSEILMAMISDMGFESFDTSEKGFTAYIPEENANNVDINNLSFSDFTYTFTIEKIAQVNWNEEWEKNFEPVVVENLICIRAPFHPANKTVKHEIIIMPKMSFGTGHHQTTQLMCEAMYACDFKDKRVLDMGCGTGVLAILAHLLKAKNILAIDIDDWSVENSIENCTANNCTGITVKKGDIESIERLENLDIILANINKNILKKHIPFYSKKLNLKGKLFLSGFFKTDVDELIELAEENSLRLQTPYFKDEWAALVFEKE